MAILDGVVVLGGDFVGRQAERQWLAAQLSAAAPDSAVVVVGEAGLGKSRLLETGLEAAEAAGRRVLTGRAVAGPQMPFRIFNEVFAGAARRFGIPEVPALAPFRGPLARVVPDWPVNDGGVVDPLLVGEGALRLLSVLRDADGLVVALEDVHWADPDSLVVIQYLCEHGANEGLAIAVTVRDDPGPALKQLRALVGTKAAWLRLSPLSPAEIGELCRSCAGGDFPEEAMRFVVEHSDGLPYAVEELVAGLLASESLVRTGGGWRVAGRLEASVPANVSLSVTERLSGLPAPQREVIDVAAILGRSFDWRLLLEISGSGEECLGDALRAGSDLGIISGGSPGSEFRFRHALTREAVLACIPSPTRIRLARTALQRLLPPATDEACALAAQLAALADDQVRSAELLAELAERMSSSGALGAAVDALGRALAAAPSHPSAGGWRMGLLRLLIAAGRLGEAEEIAASLKSEGQTAGVELALAEAAVLRHNWDRVEQLACERDVEEVNDADTARQLLVRAELAAGRFRPDEASRLVTQAVDRAERAGVPELRAEALIAAARLSQPWSPDDSRRRLAEALGLASAGGLRREVALALGALADLDVLAVVTPDHCEEALTAAYDAGAIGLVASATHNLAMLAALRYELHEADRWAGECVTLARRYHLGWLEAAGLTKEAFVAALQARTSEAESLLASAESIAGGDPRGLSLMDGNVRAAAYLNLEDMAPASAALTSACDLAEQNHLEPRPYLGMAVLVRAASGGDPEPLAAHLEDTGMIWPPVITGLVAAGRAISAGRAGETQRAEQLATRAWEVLAPTPWHEAIARRYVGESQALDRWGNKEETLSPAEAFFCRASLDAPAAACKQLRQAGSRTGTAARDVLPALAAFGVTAREAEVLELVADGLTNREIAERLYLSVRTVDKHVERLMTKTGRPNRTALAGLSLSARRNT